MNDDQIASEAVRRKRERENRPLTKADMEWVLSAHYCRICNDSGVEQVPEAWYRTKRKRQTWGDQVFNRPRRIYVCCGCYQAMEDSP